MYFKKYRGTQWVDIGDNDAYDFVQGDLTIDGLPHDIDFTGKVPAGTKWIQFVVSMKSETLGSYSIWFAKSSTSEIRRYVTSQLVIMRTIITPIMLPLDSNLKAQYKIQNITWYEMNLTIIAIGK